MTEAATPEDFPARKVLDLTPEERANLPGIEWDPFSAPQFKHLRSTNAVGEWMIGHPSQSGRHTEPVEISYRVPMEEGETYQDVRSKMNALEEKGIDAGHAEWSNEFAKMKHGEIGYALDQEVAKDFIELLRRHVPGRDVLDLLAENGFEFKHQMEPRTPGLSPTKAFYKDDDQGGFFTLFWAEGEKAHLVHEKRGANGWENLLRLSTYKELQSGFLRPNPISPEVIDPVLAGVEMAVKISNEWRPAPSVSRKKKVSP